MPSARKDHYKLVHGAALAHYHSHGPRHDGKLIEYGQIDIEGDVVRFIGFDGLPLAIYQVPEGFMIDDLRFAVHFQRPNTSDQLVFKVRAR